ncbi:MAG: Ferrochelatase [Pseudomonadota bacterium]|jgi:ferrochelatase
MSSAASYDAVLVLGFGGPEKPEDVMPFLENVVRGRNVPRERLLEVAEHYHHLGGKSPINDQCRALIAALRVELSSHGIDLPIYWGNRNWAPLLEDVVRTMRDDGVARAAVYVTSAFSSYSGCRQYREDLEKARAAVGAGAPELDKLRAFYNHPGFVDAVTERVEAALQKLPEPTRSRARLVFTAHSIPLAMASGCDYVAQLNEIAKHIAVGFGDREFDVVFQSRSGPPQVPWLEPDIGDHVRALGERGVRELVVVPLGFVSDHMEVVWDLDHEAKAIADELGVTLVRAATVGEHPLFVAMIRELIEEKLGTVSTRRTYGVSAPRPDTCVPGCCAYTPGRPPSRLGAISR